MNNQHYLRTKYLPKHPNSIPIGQTNTTQSQPQNQPQTGQVIGHIFQNVCIGGGMMTKKVPIISNQPSPSVIIGSQSSQFVSPVAVISNNHVTQPVIIGSNYRPSSHSGSFVSPVNLIGSNHLVQPVIIGTHSGSFVSPVNLIGGSSSKIVQTPIQQNQWCSCGTIIIDDSYNRRNGRTCQAIFLGLNPNTGMFELFYGKRDRSDISEESTAIRETREESCNMFVFSPDVYNNKYKVSSSDSQHHAYVVRVNAPRGGINNSVFSTNQQILKMNRAPYEWTELSSITRIDITDAINFNILSHTKGDFRMIDVDGNSIVIFSRDAEFIANALRQSMHVRGDVNQLSFINSWDDARAGGTKLYLDGTMCYKS